MKRRGRLLLTRELLAELLHLRGGLTIEGLEYDVSTQQARVFLAGEGLPWTRDGEEARVCPLSELVFP